MGWLKRRRESDAALAKSHDLLTKAEALPVDSSALPALIALSDAWLRHSHAAYPPPR